MGLFISLAQAMARTVIDPPAPAPQIAPFANVGAALLAIQQADTTANGLALRIARSFVTTVSERSGLTEAGVWDALINAPAQLVASLWLGSSWDALVTELYGPLGVSVHPTLH